MALDGYRRITTPIHRQQLIDKLIKNDIIITTKKKRSNIIWHKVAF